MRWGTIVAGLGFGLASVIVVASAPSGASGAVNPPACGGATPYRYAPPAAELGPRHPSGPIPKFRDVTRRAGLTLARAPLCGAPHCLLSEPELRAKFPNAILPVGDALNSALCQLERFTGGVAVGDAYGDGDSR